MNTFNFLAHIFYQIYLQYNV